MRKSKLIIDTPDKCEQCPLMYVGNLGSNEEFVGCNATMKIRPIGEDKPNWCPLVEVKDE